MNELVKKLGEYAAYIGNCDSVPFGTRKILEGAADAIDSLCAELKETKWIPCRDHLPEDPKTPLTIDELDKMVEYGILQECIVMIHGAEKSTTLYYAGSGEWYDPVTEEFYEVIAWQPLPEPYKQDNSAAVGEKGEES